jgi:hypothetical protein
MGECRGAVWENIATHARFTFNPDENIAGFRPGGLKRLEMLLLHGCAARKGIACGGSVLHAIYVRVLGPLKVCAYVTHPVAC